MVPDQLGLNTITLGESDASLKLYSKASTVSVSKYFEKKEKSPLFLSNSHTNSKMSFGTIFCHAAK